MPQSEVTRVVFLAHRNHDSGDGTYVTKVTVPAGYRVVSGGVYLEEFPAQYLLSHGDYPVVDSGTGRTDAWAFRYTIDGVGSSSFATVVFQVIAERSDETEAFVNLGQIQ